jgi:hypothetical protein
VGGGGESRKGKGDKLGKNGGEGGGGWSGSGANNNFSIDTNRMVSNSALSYSIYQRK